MVITKGDFSGKAAHSEIDIAFGPTRRVRRPLRRRLGSHRDGFALIAVIWGLGLITLLVMAVIVGAKYRTLVVSNDTSAAAAEAAAESAVNLGIAAVLAKTTETNYKFPMRCRMPGGERVFISLEEETGKIDLNTASSATLSRFFTALTRDQSQGMRIADGMTALRNAKRKDQNAGSATAPADPHFLTIMQLDQVDGISPKLFRAALRFVTVRSGRSEPDMDAAPATLRYLLDRDQKVVSPIRGLPAAGHVTIRADVRAAGGARYIREALIALADGGKPFLVREWRRGDIDSAEFVQSPSRDSTQIGERDCFQSVETASARSR